MISIAYCCIKMMLKKLRGNAQITQRRLGGYWRRKSTIMCLSERIFLHEGVEHL